MRLRIPKVSRAVWATAVVALAVLLLLPATSVYYEYSGGESCARCHEIRETYDLWHDSTHRSVPCAECHGGILTPDAGFHVNNARRVITHMKDEAPEQIRIRQADLPRLLERCQHCHRQEFAQWLAGPHASNYQQIFLDKAHNSRRLLMDDCLRCHGMLYEGSIADLVTPVNTKGPWRLKDAAVAALPVIPCLACHEMHRAGRPLMKRIARERRPGTGEELARPSVALLDRREMRSVPATSLPLPVMLENERVVKTSPDPRQALCYQCHAPLASQQVNSGDDRTPIGVHEGISCLACHKHHTQATRASCANCHPRLSNCGLDVEKMDTTFRDVKSPHNIHFVKCADCHPKGVPPAPRGLRVDGSGRFLQR